MEKFLLRSQESATALTSNQRSFVVHLSNADLQYVHINIRLIKYI